MPAGRFHLIRFRCSEASQGARLCALTFQTPELKASGEFHPPDRAGFRDRQLCGADNQNLSTPSVVLHAINIEMVPSAVTSEVQGSGKANPDGDFRYDASIGDTGGYIFNFKTLGLPSGSYVLNFTVAGALTIYHVPFQVR